MGLRHISYSFFKKVYYFIPFKGILFRCIRPFYRPQESIAGFLKFKGRFFIKVDGKKLYLFNNNRTLPSLLFWNGLRAYEPATIDLWRKLSYLSTSIFDIGANIGIFGLISKSVNVRSQVYFFEPLPRNSSLISKNLLLNNFSGIIETLAISNISGESIFYDMDVEENTIGSFSAEFVESHAHAGKLLPINVKVTTLDEYVSMNKITTVDLIKIDVEGHEMQVLEGAISVIRKFLPTIIMEVANDSNIPLLNSMFQGFKYQYYIISEDGRITQTLEIGKGQGGRNYLICRESVFLEMTRNFPISKSD